MNYKEQALAYSIALEMGLRSLEEAIDWADLLIERQENPSMEIIELACCKKIGDAISNLHSFASDANIAVCDQILFGILCKALRENRISYLEVAKKLYFLAIDEENTHMENFEVTNFWDDIELADAGSYGNPEEVRNNLFLLLEKNKIDIEGME